jgi:DNA polymerase-3 subunit delta'
MPLNDLLINKSTREQLGQFVQQPTHTLALVGAGGIGKKTLAVELAASILHISSEKFQAYPYLRVYSPVNNTISVETAREIIGFTKLKTSGKQAIRRVIIIEDAQALTIEAQNALLKTLEEPPKDTLFILTITSAAEVLPTILSRTQIIHIPMPAKDMTTEYFQNKGFADKDITLYHFMSGGLPGLMSALLTESSDHSLVAAIQQVKEILQSDSFQRLAKIDSLVKDKNAPQLVQVLSQVSRSALYAEAAKESSNQAVLKKWTTILTASEKAKLQLSKNGQPKLVVTNLFLHI